MIEAGKNRHKSVVGEISIQPLSSLSKQQQQ
jgi:hypothetical protein